MTSGTPFPTPPPLSPEAAGPDAHVPGASPGQALGRFFTGFARFHGRAGRAEYWWVFALNVVVLLGGMIAFAVLQPPTDAYGEPIGSTAASGTVMVLLGLYLLAIFLPSIALNARRLYDVNMSGWMQLLSAVPVVGGFFMPVIALMPSVPAGARFDRPAPAPLPYLTPASFR